MPITALQLAGNLSITLQKVVAGFNPVKAGPNQVNFDLSAIDLTVYTQAYQAKLTTTTTIDLTSFTNLAGEAVNLAKALAMVVTCAGGSVVLKPGASNGLSGWFFGSTDGIAFADGDSMIFLRDPGKTPVTVDSTHKTITFTVTGSPTVTVAIIGG
jgi:hypothetical protein